MSAVDRMTNRPAPAYDARSRINDNAPRYSDGYMRTLDAAAILAVVVMFLGPLITAVFRPTY